MSQVAISNTPELAYEHAYARHWADVFRFALAWTNDWAQAEDLAQDAFLRLWDHRTRIDWDRPVLPWLLVTTRRLATDRFRRLRRRLMAEPLPAAPIGRQPARGDQEPGQDRWLDVRDAMKHLTPVERAALV